jgi:hypothetical protein
MSSAVAGGAPPRDDSHSPPKMRKEVPILQTVLVPRIPFNAKKGASVDLSNFVLRDVILVELAPSGVDIKGYGRHPLAVDAGGIRYHNTEEIEEQRKIIWQFVKTVGSSFLEYADLINQSLPVGIFEPRSNLERMCEQWTHAPTFLVRAGLCSDPVERFKNVIAFAVSGLQYTLSQKKPFNPILGETYQATWPDGSEVFLEQTSHHPPVSSWQIIGPNRVYTFNGYGVWSASIRANSIRGQQTGEQYVSFTDGSRVSFTLPYAYMRGVAWGDRTIEYFGEMTFTDATHQLSCTLKFNPDAKGWVKSFFSRAPTIPTDYFRGEILSGVDPKKKVLHQVEGSWIACLLIDNERYWDISAHKGVPPAPIEAPLPSDARNRVDRIALASGDLEAAAEFKSLLEEKQRHAARLRKLNPKSSHT